MGPQLKLFLLDADIVIFGARGDVAVRSAIRRHGSARIMISALVYSQILQGTGRSSHAAIACHFAEALGILPYDGAASAAYGEIVAQLGFNRRNTFDRMIAGHAISLGATLVTNNVRDFAEIPGLATENWSDPDLR